MNPGIRFANRKQWRTRAALAAAAVLALALPAMAGMLGIGVKDITPDRMSELKLKEERGVEVTVVTPGSAAEKAGLKVRDVVVEYNGTRVDSAAQFQRLVRETPAGRTARLAVSRDGATQTITAKLAERYEAFQMRLPHAERGFAYAVPRPPMPPRVEIPAIGPIEVFTHSRRIGIDAQTLSKQLGDYFGAPNGEGVLVRSVQSGTPAEKAGLKAGDVIVKVDSERVTSLRDLRDRLRQSRDKTSVPMTIIRDKKEMVVQITPERDERGGFFGPVAPELWNPPEMEVEIDFVEQV